MAMILVVGFHLYTPWKTIAKVNGSRFNPGDQILFKRGDIWKAQLTVPCSGKAGTPLTFAAYGNGNKPIITLRDFIPGWNSAGSWTPPAQNVWSMSLLVNPLRLWLSGTEYKKAQTLAKVDSTSRWFWGSNILYVYSTSNPAFNYSNVEASVISGSVSARYPVYIRQKDYITVQDLDIRGGHFAVYISEGGHIIVSGCNIGMDTGRNGIGVDSWSSEDSEDITIANNTIESGFNFSYDYEAVGVGDGINIVNSMKNSKLYSNTISNWGHSLINMDATSSSNTISNNEIYKNILSSPNTSYCRGFGVQGTTDSNCTGNKFYKNIIKNTTVRNQINGNANEFYYNIIYSTRNSLAKTTAQAHGVSLEGYMGYVCHDNRIYNNVFYDLDEPAIWVCDGSGFSSKYGNLIRNNIIMDAGKNSRDGYNNVGIRIDPGSTVGPNTYENNNVYSLGNADVIYYRGVSKSVASFTLDNGNKGDVINSNIQSDSLFIDPGQSNFHLKNDSMCIGAGKYVGLTEDYDGIKIPPDKKVNIGAFQYRVISAPINTRILQ